MKTDKKIDNSENKDFISDLFQKLLNNEVIYNKKTSLSYSKGENIFKQGAFAPYIIYITEGLIKSYLQADRNKQINLSIAKKGDFLAFSSVFDEPVYKYSAVALKDSTVCMIDKEALKQILLKNPEFALKITSENFRKQNRLLNIILNLSHKQMPGKLASALLYLTSDKFENDKIFDYLSRKDIAEFAGITPESTVRMLKDFEKDKVIKLTGKNIEIINNEMLFEIDKRG